MTARKTLTLLVAAIALLALPLGTAQAGVIIDVGFGGRYYRPYYRHHYRPVVVVAPAPVVVAPRPIYVTPAPVYVAPVPATVYAIPPTGPAPVYVQPPPVSPSPYQPIQ
jgi:hypothetical protein